MLRNPSKFFSLSFSRFSKNSITSNPPYCLKQNWKFGCSTSHLSCISKIVSIAYTSSLRIRQSPKFSSTVWFVKNLTIDYAISSLYPIQKDSKLSRSQVLREFATANAASQARARFQFLISNRQRSMRELCSKNIFDPKLSQAKLLKIQSKLLITLRSVEKVSGANFSKQPSSMSLLIIF